MSKIWTRLVVLFLLPSFLADPALAAFTQWVPNQATTQLRQSPPCFTEEALAVPLLQAPLHPKEETAYHIRRLEDAFRIERNADTSGLFHKWRMLNGHFFHEWVGHWLTLWVLRMKGVKVHFGNSHIFNTPGIAVYLEPPDGNPTKNNRDDWVEYYRHLNRMYKVGLRGNKIGVTVMIAVLLISVVGLGSSSGTYAVIASILGLLLGFQGIDSNLSDYYRNSRPESDDHRKAMLAHFLALSLYMGWSFETAVQKAQKTQKAEPNALFYFTHAFPGVDPKEIAQLGEDIAILEKEMTQSDFKDLAAAVEQGRNERGIAPDRQTFNGVFERIGRSNQQKAERLRRRFDELVDNPMLYPGWVRIRSGTIPRGMLISA